MAYIGYYIKIKMSENVEKLFGAGILLGMVVVIITIWTIGISLETDLDINKKYLIQIKYFITPKLKFPV